MVVCDHRALPRGAGIASASSVSAMVRNEAPRAAMAKIRRAIGAVASSTS